ncbi:MAG: glucose-6-phosphate isomerase [Planctomycetes bacterium ADurb.Bin401]|nr:MAG: glucose-6-phosphate isomerase [Planctomycetes bacterium ADurb.Bin401]
MATEPMVKDLDSGNQYQSLLKPPATNGLHAGRVYLEPGGQCGRHSTGQKEEMLVFLSGKGQALIEKKILPVGAGKIAYIPPNTEHNIVNNSNEPLSYIFCVMPVHDKE